MTYSEWAEAANISRIRQLTEVSRALTYAASLDQVFRLTADRAADLLAGEMSLLLIANDDGLLELRASHGVDPTLAERIHMPLNEALVPQLAELLNVQRESFLGVPLVVAGAVQGLLVVIRAAPLKPTGATEDEWLLSALADQAALALEKNHLDEVGVFREQLMAIVGHDLRGPLSTIQMAAEFLMRREGLGAQETEAREEDHAEHCDRGSPRRSVAGSDTKPVGWRNCDPAHHIRPGRCLPPGRRRDRAGPP